MRAAVLVGLAWGVFCGVANGWPVASTLAQMAAPWIWVAAFAAYRGARSGKHGALLGAVALLAANVAYFGIGSIARGVSGLSFVGGLSFFVLWTTIGLVIGPIAGVLGWWLNSGRRTLVAVAMLGTVSLAEPLALWAHIDHFDSHVAYVVVGLTALALPLVWYRGRWRQAMRGLGLILVLTYPTAVVLEAALIALRQISSPMRLI